MQIYFQSGDLGDFGFELYCGEAMLGLLTAHQHLGHERYLTSVQRALPQYERIYRSAQAQRGQQGKQYVWGRQQQAWALLCPGGHALEVWLPALQGLCLL